MNPLCECGHPLGKHRAPGGPCAACGCQGFANQPDIPVRRSFTELPAAYAYAASAAAIQLKRWFVCRRLGKWYAIEPGIANVVRRNPDWPARRMERS